LVSSGLNPTIGIFHKNKYNAYCCEFLSNFVDLVLRITTST